MSKNLPNIFYVTRLIVGFIDFKAYLLGKYILYIQY